MASTWSPRAIPSTPNATTFTFAFTSTFTSTDPLTTTSTITTTWPSGDVANRERRALGGSRDRPGAEAVEARHQEHRDRAEPGGQPPPEAGGAPPGADRQ